MNKSKLVVIGNGMVGHHFLTALAERGGKDQFAITVIGEEPHTAYDRVHLSEYFSGRTLEQLSLVEAGDFDQIELLLGDPATAIDRSKKVVTTAAGKSLAYDQLVLATGSYPFVPPVPGREREQCYVYRTIEDLDGIMAGAKRSRVGVVVGGGLLGLEAANALTNLGLEAHVVEFAPQLMGVQLDQGGGEMLRRKIEALGVTVHTGRNTKEIVDGSEHLHRMNFADGQSLETDLILFSAGIRPQDKLAAESGLVLGERGGIEIDDGCRTSDPDIYAIGECALWQGRIFGLVAPGYQMAKAAAEVLLGGEGRFRGADMSTKLKLLGVEVGSIGDAHGRTEGSYSYQFQDERSESYKRMVVSADGTTLLGAVLVGDTSAYDTLLQYALNGIELPDSPEALILPASSGGAEVGLGPDKLPATAQICSCHDVTKGAICEAMDNGCRDLASLKSVTKASTGCGGCAALLKSVFDAELVKRGIEVNTDICEHFGYTRQALFHLIQVEEIRSFDELIQKHGRGLGCEICKPAVASCLASCWNEYVLEPPHAGLQDTNDRFLANMQKDGTYSVVPRVAGGEITPDKLIVLGEVARDFGLYTKVTGGQRIDLFGARMEQLPQIWSRLIAAGFETGHAYAKSLRTVKSCVGSTWCRYGIDDSVGLAIELENRYKGLRSPHKLKMGVSGCTRECAEAQSKDVGVIATERGWNLYVCGNGGMKPRHTDLLATDLDRATLIRYIDRFLMFYVRTADRLQRTSVWFEGLEGGLDYLKAVVIDDQLGLGDELERQMQHLVETYACEWQRTLDDDAAARRFRAFVNTDDLDNGVVRVVERGQPRPATEQERRDLAVTSDN
ncbi:MAG: nitrite reductase large subunit NirB [Gammaproteobacteria bacterium]|nr:nitrite reductase large subunit NirB [Gammaproteobacteria bacterium]